MTHGSHTGRDLGSGVFRDTNPRTTLCPVGSLGPESTQLRLDDDPLSRPPLLSRPSLRIRGRSKVTPLRVPKDLRPLPRLPTCACPPQRGTSVFSDRPTSRVGLRVPSVPRKAQVSTTPLLTPRGPPESQKKRLRLTLEYPEPLGNLTKVVVTVPDKRDPVPDL